MSDLDKPITRPRIGGDGVESVPKPETVIQSTPQSITMILRNQRAIQDLKESMTEDVHYGKPYAGSNKKTLKKPGAEWVQKLYGIRPQYEEVERIIQPNFDDLSKSWILFHYRCNMVEIATGHVVGEALGSCHSLEDKYHWRKASRRCIDPNCSGQVYRSKYPDNLPEDKRGWYCRDCKTKYSADDTRITGQEVGQAVNANPMDLVNTICKIAQKRAYVSAVLNATAASSIFAPGDDDGDDIDIITVDAPEAPAQPQASPAQESKPKSTPKPPSLDTKRLIEYIAFMYPDDEDGFHRRGTIKNLLEDGTLNMDMPGFEATERILLHRAFKDFKLDKPMVFLALTAAADNGDVIATWADWYGKDGKERTIQQAWEALVAHNDNKDLPPAQVKPQPNTASTASEESAIDIPF